MKQGRTLTQVPLTAHFRGGTRSVTGTCNSIRIGWRTISQKMILFSPLEWPWKTWRKLFKGFSPDISLPLCVTALINIRGLNKYLQIISLTLKNNWWIGLGLRSVLKKKKQKSEFFKKRVNSSWLFYISILKNKTKQNNYRSIPIGNAS